MMTKRVGFSSSGYFVMADDSNDNEAIPLAGFCFCHVSRENFIWSYLPVILAGLKTVT